MDYTVTYCAIKFSENLNNNNNFICTMYGMYSQQRAKR